MGVIPPERGRFTVRDIFFDHDGLRAIWAILLFLVLREAITDIVWTLSGLYLPQAPAAVDAGQQPAQTSITPLQLLAGESIGLAGVACATWIMSKIELRPLRAYGFGGRRSLVYLLAGFTWGIVLLSLLVLGLRASGLLVFDTQLLFGREILRYGAIWFGGYILVALFEESFTRGYLQFTLTRGLSGLYRRRFSESRATACGFWTAALILSCAFGLGHKSNEGESPIGLVAAGLVGIVLCLSLWRTGSLWWAIGFHAAWDWAQSFLYGVANSGSMVQGRLFGTRPTGRPILSGGLTGPEGSIFILPIIALTAAVIVLTLPRAHPGYPHSRPDASPDAPEAPRQSHLHLDLP